MASTASDVTKAVSDGVLMVAGGRFGRCQRSPKESHSGSPIWSQRGDMTGLDPWGLSLVLLASVAAAGAAGGELLLGVFGTEALARDLDEVGPVGEPIEGRGGQQRLAEDL